MNPKLEKILKIPLYQKLLLLLLANFLIVAAFIFLMYLPKADELSALKASNDQVTGKLTESRRIAGNLPKFKAEYEKMQEQLDKALTELPNASEIPALLSSIASLAKDNGLEIIRFRPEKEIAKGFYAEVPVELVVSGSFHQAALFFQSVSDLSRIVNITNVGLRPKDGAKLTEGFMPLVVDCVAVTFRFIEEKK